MDRPEVRQYHEANPGLVRLVHVTTVPMSLGFLRGQVGYMKARGFEIQAISSPGEALEAFGTRENVVVHAVEMPRRITPLGDLLAVWRLRGILRRLRPQIVHAHTPKGGLLGMVAARLAGVPVRLYHMRGLPLMTARGWKRALLRGTERLSCSLAHRVVCVSHSLRDVALAEGLCPPEKIEVLAGGSGNGVDATGRFDPTRYGEEHRKRLRREIGIPENGPVIGFVGRIVRDKGVAELASAWQILRSEFPDLHLVVIGRIEPQDPLPAETLHLLQKDDRVHLTGPVPDPAPLYAIMDIAALPTYREGLPNVPLEAAAMGLPVVATRIPGCVDAVADGQTGTLVPPRDAETLAIALRHYLNNPDLRRRHGAAGRARVLCDFRQEVIWELLHQRYAGLLRDQDLLVPDAVEPPPHHSATGALSGNPTPTLTVSQE